MAGVFVGGVLTLIAMNAPALLRELTYRVKQPRTVESPPMSPAGKVQIKNAAWLLCAALLGGLVGSAVAHARTDEIDRESSRGVRGRRLGYPKLEDEISSLMYRARARR